MTGSAGRDSYDLIVVGAGVVGCSVAWHAAALGAGRVGPTLAAPGVIGPTGDEGRAAGGRATPPPKGGTMSAAAATADLARRSWSVFTGFRDYLGDGEADCGLVRCGYLIVGGDDARGEAVRASLAQQRAMGIRADEIDAAQARALLPLLRTDDLAVFGHEPDAGYADAYLTATAFARAARRRGVEIRQGLRVDALATSGSRVTGIVTGAGTYSAATVVCVANVWTNRLLESTTGTTIPLVA
ncbi:MAG TPA: FAD-binding oxidoreductase, partial [Burkholderiaceae bacterium]|nr:FAD-binding oxidoreductase [Burkholderiaceae bacterium]